MSVRATFSFGSPDGIEGHLLSGPMPEFLRFLDEMEHNDPSLAVPGLRSLVEKVIQVGAPALSSYTAAQAAVVDALVEVYYNWFCGGLGVRANLLLPADTSI